ncbi:amino acid ABC transporter membrane protein (PAAT family) [Halanaerobium saccharolyticum]|uniref:Amino acid ABC transporter membrane protein (PAAT family) n=1 Tax=Halanaerobium saccharolyticum TaxID=43595 RepID=A0A4R7YZQ5_9FIRM|nr:amino acid ABC transporter permease [Halanaerobium saccharolyticum]RAK07142.1 polar amino acid transport system permease protein [Halanaerobium saccharolyticum]TDW01846.1 amino acid ABC transporter membrane protein (PAAT family) [Halanaerobium saccharolyticum]TDX53092.1 polar amino acid transport system permease protein [Halanaerobium saccharolyticum]
MFDYIINVSGYILEGSLITFQLYLVTAIFSVILGIAGALGKISKIPLLKSILSFYTWVFRGTPLLLQLFFAYYGLPVLGITLEPFPAAALTFIVNYGAYFTEIFRGGIESINEGQYEAAKVLGMNYRQTMSRIIIPQTVKRVLPATSNEAINLVKDSALVAVIGLGDLLRAAKVAVTRDFSIIPFIIAAVFYLVISSVIVTVFRKLEEKYSVYE